ncbi:hypothetical protein [Klebsiella variicola]
MTKSTITREQLEEWVTQFDEDGGCDATDRQLEALIRQSLAAMDSEPVATLDVQSRRPDGNKFALVFSSAAHKLPDDVYFLYRHAQQAPVVSADLLHTAASAIEDLLELTDPNTSYYSGVWADVPGKLRAAMFQAKSLTGNSPVIGIDLASGPDRTVEVHYVAPPGYVMVPKEPTEAMMLHNSGCQHHAWDDPDCAMRQTRRLIWSHMLAAAPQEVK